MKVLKVNYKTRNLYGTIFVFWAGKKHVWSCAHTRSFFLLLVMDTTKTDTWEWWSSPQNGNGNDIVGNVSSFHIKKTSCECIHLISCTFYFHSPFNNVWILTVWDIKSNWALDGEKISRRIRFRPKLCYFVYFNLGLPVDFLRTICWQAAYVKKYIQPDNLKNSQFLRKLRWIINKPCKNRVCWLSNTSR